MILATTRLMRVGPHPHMPWPSHSPVTSSDKWSSARNRPDTSSPNWSLCVFVHILIQNGVLVSGLSLAFLTEVTWPMLIR